MSLDALTRRAAASLLAALPLLGCEPADGGTEVPLDRRAAPEVDLASRFDQERAWRHLERIVGLGPRPSGTRRNAELRDLLASELAALGLEAVREPFEEATPIGRIAFENVYADLPARDADAPLVILGTHFDTKRVAGVEFVGANDGGSGTAVLLELARVLAGEPRDVAYRLLFLDGEEAIRPFWADPDNRYGSRRHVAELQRTGAIERVAAFVLLDLVGDVDLRFQTELFSNRELLGLFFRAAKENGLARHVDGRPQEVTDDHLSFAAAGVPSVDLIDLEYGPGNRWWHTADDTLANCSADSLGATGRIVLHALPELEAWVLRAR